MRTRTTRLPLLAPTLLATTLLATTLLATAGLALTACSSPSDGPDSAPRSAVPSADVVAAVRTDSTLAAALPASIKEAGAITYGTTLQPGTAGLPYSGTVGGRNVGLQKDLIDAVAKVLGVTATAENGTFPTIVPGVQNGKYDVGLANFGVTAEREKVLDFATYLDDGQSFLASKDVKITKATTLTDICGLTVATSPGSTFQQLLEDGRDDCAKAGRKPFSVKYFSTSAPIILGLQNGSIDVEFGPTLSLTYTLAHIDGTKYLGQVASTPVGFVTAKGSPLAKALQRAVNVLIKDGDYAKILAKWGVTNSGITSSEFNPTPNF